MSVAFSTIIFIKTFSSFFNEDSDFDYTEWHKDIIAFENSICQISVEQQSYNRFKNNRPFFKVMVDLQFIIRFFDIFTFFLRKK